MGLGFFGFWLKGDNANKIHFAFLESIFGKAIAPKSQKLIDGIGFDGLNTGRGKAIMDP